MNVRLYLTNHVVTLTENINNYVGDMTPCNHTSRLLAHPWSTQMLESDDYRPNSNYHVHKEMHDNDPTV